jgi:hypothetical protein
MTTVKDNPALLALLVSNRMGYMKNWWALSSEDTVSDFNVTERFKDIPTTSPQQDLNDEQAIHFINPCVCVIKGMITIVLIANK